MTKQDKQTGNVGALQGNAAASEATPANSFKGVIAAWLANAEKPSNAPSQTRHALARMLLQSKDMSRAWREFERCNIDPLHLLAMAHSALVFAAREVRRQNPSEISAQINRVERLIRELQQAIEQSPLPRDWGTLTEWKTLNEPSILVNFGWHGMDDDVDRIGYPVTVFGVLDGALELIDDYRKSEPTRLVLREKNSGKNLERTVFVRHLSGQLKKRYGVTLAGSLAHLTNAIFDADTLLSKEEVAGIVKSSPLSKNKAIKRGSKASNQQP